MDQEQEARPQVWEELQEELHRPLQACDNTCFCKVCCFHCILCFHKKALGIRYYVPRPRRASKKISHNQVSLHN
ncbi:tat protein [Simian immunodeficiency virus - agm.sab-1]|uniref:Protein Tat n=1 Tax=Simian immunodeficiency virus - agm.sab-1 TaxID=349974 RepID=Q87111_SIVSA|nr:trans-activating transcription regulator - simian immunodeficiency virus SIVagm (isolate SAB-1) [Simian immunodeficiency virus - agm]AAA21507.1 tat protein [Simian immunodeficiency virus - agm.sab-1]